ncbi:MAG: hypothetical protein DMG89_13360 [Acidobacteria bacterium]|nr:MAG: hypothetical protein DMG89_13360 [Acidobacteriota bacterium]
MVNTGRTKPSPASANQRRYARFPLDIRIEVHVLRKGSGFSFWGRTSELGLDGVGATLTGELEVGEVVSLELSLPMVAHPAKVRALVRYRDGLRHGFEFLTMNKEQRNALRRVCEVLGTGT